jgi:hypothetical protein
VINVAAVLPALMPQWLVVATDPVAGAAKTSLERIFARRFGLFLTRVSAAGRRHANRRGSCCRA